MKLLVIVGVLPVLSGCAVNPPSPEIQAEEVLRLEAGVVPVLDEFDVRFYLDRGPYCGSIVYRRGEFRSHDERCGSPTEAYRLFDEQVQGDFGKIRAAIAASRVKIRRFEASFAADGSIRTISFRREDCSIEWNWNYLYDRGNVVAKDGTSDFPKYTRITEDWWLVTEVDD